MSRVLLDSVVIIDALNDLPEAVRYVREVREVSVVSVVTRAEVLVGYPEKESVVATDLLDLFPTMGIDGPVADLSAQLRRLHRWKLPDAFQAAIAQIHGLRLATRNTRDFPEERFPFVVVPYRV